MQGQKPHTCSHWKYPFAHRPSSTAATYPVCSHKLLLLLLMLCVSVYVSSVAVASTDI